MTSICGDIVCMYVYRFKACYPFRLSSHEVHLYEAKPNKWTSTSVFGDSHTSTHADPASVRLFIAGRGPAYSTQHWDHIAVQCACPGRGRESVGVCLSGISIVRPASSRRGLLSGVALTGAVYYTSQRPAKSVYFNSRRHGRRTWHYKVPATVTVYRGHRQTFFILPGIISLFIVCVGIIRNNSLVGGRAQAESKPGHWARHALLHMVAEYVNHAATKAGDFTSTLHDIDRHAIMEAIPTLNFTSRWVANLSDFGLLGEQTSPKWEIPCPVRRWTTVLSWMPLALSSPEKSVTVQTKTNKQNYIHALLIGMCG